MCGRFKLATDPEAIAREFDVAEVPAMPPRYNIAPTQPVLVVRAGQDGRRTATFLRWGLVPSWSRDAGGASRMINARSESAAGKPAFRDAMRRRRCLVVADGFYEWARDGRVRRPFLIALPGGRPFAFAGLWDRWEGPGGPLETCTILTTAATARVAVLHDRMPVILRPEAVAPWLAAGPLAPDALAAICAPRPDEDLALAPVSPLVNSPFVDDPRCAAPWQDEGTLL